MDKIKAITVDPQAETRLALTETHAPQPGAAEALVRVEAISLNRGEIRQAMAAQKPYVIGWDLAGTIEKPAADGSGPHQGARVVGLVRNGGWAELVAVPTRNLAELPQSVSFGQAATLPVAGITALMALEKGGSLLEKTVLVTGASGGVGIFAVEMARHSGARVIAITRQQQHMAAVKEAGADEVVSGSDAAELARFAPYHLIVDGVGGAVLAGALDLLAEGGAAVTYGMTGGSEVTINGSKFYNIGGGALYGLKMWYELTREPASHYLDRLARLVASDRLHPRIEVEAPWEQIAEIARRLMDREYTGKAVLYTGATD